MNKIELLSKKIELKNRALDILKKGKTEKRVLNENENKDIEEIRSGIKDIDKQIEELDKKLVDEKRQADEEKKINVNLNRMKNKKTITGEIRRMLTTSQYGIISVPAFENRAGAKAVATPQLFGDAAPTTYTAAGSEIVPTEIEPLLTGNYANSVLGQFTNLTGLTADVNIPLMDKNQAGWAGEVGTATQTAAGITALSLKPKRIAAYSDISKTLIMQANSNIEEIVRQDLQNAIIDKLQSTILGNAAGSDTQPAGLFVDASALGAVDYQHITQIEEDIEAENVIATAYVINPTVKAKCRQTPKVAAQGGFLFDAGELDGMPTFVTTACSGILYGNLKDYVLGQWGNINITIDPYSQELNGYVRLVIDANFDGGIRRAGSVKAYTI